MAPPRTGTARGSSPVTWSGGVRNSSAICVMPSRVAGLRAQRHQHQQRHHHGARPVRHLRQVEEEPPRQVHDLDRHHRRRAPRHLAEQRQLDAGEHVAALGTRPSARIRGRGPAPCAARPDRCRRPPSARNRPLRWPTGWTLAAVEQRPAAIRHPADAAQVDADARLQAPGRSGRGNAPAARIRQGMVASASSTNSPVPVRHSAARAGRAHSAASLAIDRVSVVAKVERLARHRASTPSLSTLGIVSSALSLPSSL